jgi:hypothetical protein
VQPAPAVPSSERKRCEPLTPLGPDCKPQTARPACKYDGHGRPAASPTAGVPCVCKHKLGAFPHPWLVCLLATERKSGQRAHCPCLTVIRRHQAPHAQHSWARRLLAGAQPRLVVGKVQRGTCGPQIVSTRATSSQRPGSCTTRRPCVLTRVPLLCAQRMGLIQLGGGLYRWWPNDVKAPEDDGHMPSEPLAFHPHALRPTSAKIPKKSRPASSRVELG